MQNMSAAQCQAVATDVPATVIDIRDNNFYTVRYINGNCWMTQNLAYDLTGVTTLTSDTSDVTGTVTFATPPVDSTGNSSTDPYFHIYTESERNGLTAEQTGILYNYAAATAGTIATDENADLAEQSICPKGWTLPTYEQQSSITSESALFSPVYSGFFFGGSVYGVGSNGYWWSSTADDEWLRYYLVYSGGSLYTSYLSRGYGYSVRCVLRSAS